LLQALREFLSASTAPARSQSCQGNDCERYHYYADPAWCGGFGWYVFLFIVDTHDAFSSVKALASMGKSKRDANRAKPVERPYVFDI
jgi:hypothetical protein